MKRLLLLFLSLILAISFSCSGSNDGSIPTYDITGCWQIRITPNGAKAPNISTWMVRHDDSDSFIIQDFNQEQVGSGTVSWDKMAAHVIKDGYGLESFWDGTITDGKISGTYKRIISNQITEEGTFESFKSQIIDLPTDENEFSNESNGIITTVLAVARTVIKVAVRIYKTYKLYDWLTQKFYVEYHNTAKHKTQIQMAYNVNNTKKYYPLALTSADADGNILQENAETLLIPADEKVWIVIPCPSSMLGRARQILTVFAKQPNQASNISQLDLSIDVSSSGSIYLSELFTPDTNVITDPYSKISFDEIDIRSEFLQDGIGINQEVEMDDSNTTGIELKTPHYDLIDNMAPVYLSITKSGTYQIEFESYSLDGKEVTEDGEIYLSVNEDGLVYPSLDDYTSLKGKKFEFFGFGAYQFYFRWIRSNPRTGGVWIYMKIYQNGKLIGTVPLIMHSYEQDVIFEWNYPAAIYSEKSQYDLEGLTVNCYGTEFIDVDGESRYATKAPYKAEDILPPDQITSKGYKIYLD